jgi:hypothetical protein
VTNVFDFLVMVGPGKWRRGRNQRNGLLVTMHVATLASRDFVRGNIFEVNSGCERSLRRGHNSPKKRRAGHDQFVTVPFVALSIR